MDHSARLSLMKVLCGLSGISLMLRIIIFAPTALAKKLNTIVVRSSVEACELVDVYECMFVVLIYLI
jgi:hypothetical protein